MASPSKFSVAKWAAYLLPVAKAVFLGQLDLKDGLFKDIVDSGIDLLGDDAKKKLETFLKGRPDAVRDVLDQHLIRHTGAVLGRMVERYAEEKVLEKHRPLLREAAKAVPEAWKEFLAANTKKMQSARGEGFNLLMVGVLSPLSLPSAQDSKAFVEFFRWLAVHKNLIGPLLPDLTPALCEWITQHLDRELFVDLCKDNEEANAAWKESVLRLSVEEQEKLRLALERLGEIKKKQDETLKKLDDLVDDPGFDLRAYADAVLDRLAPLPLAQIVNQPDVPTVSVTDVFVPLMMRSLPLQSVRRLSHAKEIAEWDGREDQYASPEELRRRKEEMAEFLRSTPAESVLDVLAARPLDNFILLAEAGGGKTLLARHLAVSWARQQGTKPQPDKKNRLPIYIELKDYARALHDKSASSLLSYVHSAHFPLHPLSKKQLRRLLDDAEAYFILDGLDEVLDREIKARIIHDMVHRSGHQWDFVLTSRIADFDPAAWEQALNWHPYRIEPLALAEQKVFIQRYHEAFFRDARDRATRIQRLHAKLRDFHRLAELAGTPLLLTLLCLVNRSAALPETRTQLYEQAAELLLHDWDFFHFQHKGTTHLYHLAPLAKDEKHLILRRLAWLLMMGRPAQRESEDGLPADSNHLSANLFPIFYVEEAVRTALEELNKPNVSNYVELVPELLVNRNSVLCPAAEGKQSFIHRTFLEFYAAWAWQEEEVPWLSDVKPADMTAEERFEALFAPHWQDSAWRVILVLHMGRVRAVFAEKLLRQLLALGQSRQGIEDKMAATLFHQESVLLAAECFSETQQRGRLQNLDADLRHQIETLARHDIGAVDPFSKEFELLSSHLRRGVRLHSQLWDGSADGHAWLYRLFLGSELPWPRRCEAIIQLGQLLGAVPSLRDALLLFVADSNQNLLVRPQAIDTLGAVWGREDWLRDALFPLMADSNREPAVRIQTIKTLAAVWGCEDWLSKALLTLVADSDQDKWVRCQAIETLGGVWGREDWLRAALLPLVADSTVNDVVHHQVIETLGGVWGREDWLREALLPLITDSNQDEWVRRHAIKTLGRVWGREDSMRDALLALVADSAQDTVVRRQAIDSLGEVWGREDRLRDELLALLADNKTDEWSGELARHWLEYLWPEEAHR